MRNDTCELSMDQLDHVNGGEVTVVVDKGYVGIQIMVGGYGFGVWVTGGSLCGATFTPKHIGGTCIP